MFLLRRIDFVSMMPQLFSIRRQSIEFSGGNYLDNSIGYKKGPPHLFFSRRCLSVAGYDINVSQEKAPGRKSLSHWCLRGLHPMALKIEQ